MGWQSIIPEILSFKEFKKWVTIWRKFKGRSVRVWLHEKLAFQACFALPQFRRWMKERGSWISPKADIYGLDEIDQTKNGRMVIAGALTAEGTIDTIIEFPFGLLLKDVVWWISQSNPKTKEPVVKKIKTDIESVFIPIEQIIRLDFLRDKN